MRNYVLSILFFCTLFITTPVCASGFSDVQQNSELQLATEELRKHNVISGYSDGSFKPNNTLTRAQLAKMIATSLQLPVPETTVEFDDVAKTNANYGYIQALVAKKIVSGFPDGSFKPNAVVTRAQAAKMLATAYNIPSYNATLPFSDITVHTERYGYVQALYFNGIASGTSATTFSPGNKVTRGQAALFIYRAWQLKKGAAINEITLDNSTSASIIHSEGNFFKTVVIGNKIRVLPLTNGTGYFFVKGDVDEHYVLYEVKASNKKATVKIVEWYDYTDIQFNYYTFDNLQFPYTLQAVAIHNSDGDLVTDDQYFIDYNKEGLELALLKPGKYTMTLSSTTGEQKTYTIIAKFKKLTLQTIVYL